MNLIITALWAGDNLPLPDPLVRAGISRLVEIWRRELAKGPASAEADFAHSLNRRAVAEHPGSANEQHYELPSRFFELILGPHLKYSCGFYEGLETTLADAERLALEKSAEHAALADGQEILELGCGWGSLTLFMAENWPEARITAVSNSAPQRRFIETRLQARGLSNVSVITADMNDFEPDARFDRVVSVEMFEHMSNWQVLLERLRSWLHSDGRFFMHVFAHENRPYRYDHTDPEDWIAQHFFTGGIMPSHGLIGHFNALFEVEGAWRWSGEHYARTARDWLANYDANRSEIGTIMEEVYGPDAKRWQRRWRLFFLATEGLFGHAGGEPWGVSHYRLKPVPA